MLDPKNMLDFNFEKNMSEKMLNIFYCCYFDTRNETGTG